MIPRNSLVQQRGTNDSEKEKKKINHKIPVNNPYWEEKKTCFFFVHTFKVLYTILVKKKLLKKNVDKN